MFFCFSFEDNFLLFEFLKSFFFFFDIEFSMSFYRAHYFKNEWRIFEHFVFQERVGDFVRFYISRTNSGFSIIFISRMNCGFLRINNKSKIEDYLRIFLWEHFLFIQNGLFQFLLFYIFKFLFFLLFFQRFPILYILWFHNL